MQFINHTLQHIWKKKKNEKMKKKIIPKTNDVTATWFLLVFCGAVRSDHSRCAGLLGGRGE